MYIGLKMDWWAAPPGLGIFVFHGEIEGRFGRVSIKYLRSIKLLALIISNSKEYRPGNI
jgi:hypothetical protein